MGSVLSIPQCGRMKGAFNDRTVICAGSGAQTSVVHVLFPCLST